jgi:hypothetical protein
MEAANERKIFGVMVLELNARVKYYTKEPADLETR